MIKTIKEKVKNFFRHRHYLVCPVCGSDVSIKEGCRVLNLSVDGTVGVYAVHRECEKTLKDSSAELKLKKVRTLY